MFNGFLVRFGLVQVSKFFKWFGLDPLKPNRTELLPIVRHLANLGLHNKFEHSMLGMAIFLAFCWVKHYMHNTFSMLSISMG